MRRNRHGQARKLAQQVGDYVRDHPTALIGGTIAVGYLAARWLMHRRNRNDNLAAFHITDADRALDFQPRGDRDPPADVVGDPSVRTSVGLEPLSAERERI
jgi:hypothetical protein